MLADTPISFLPSVSIENFNKILPQSLLFFLEGIFPKGEIKQ